MASIWTETDPGAIEYHLHPDDFDQDPPDDVEGESRFLSHGGFPFDPDDVDPADRPHSLDSQCDTDPETLNCRSCDVHHGEPCEVCAQRAFHLKDCPDSPDPTSGGEGLCPLCRHHPHHEECPGSDPCPECGGVVECESGCPSSDLCPECGSHDPTQTWKNCENCAAVLQEMVQAAELKAGWDPNP